MVLQNLLLNADLNSRLTVLVNDLEGEVLHVALNILVVELASDQTLDVEDGSLGVRGVLVLGWSCCQRMLAESMGGGQLTCVSNKSLLVVPCDVRRSDTVTLVVDENFDLAALHDTNTRVGGSKIDADDGARNGLVTLLCSGASAEEHHGRKKHQEEVEDC